MSYQSRFLTFHDRIKLKRGTHEALLNDKRRQIESRLRSGLSRRFTLFNRGSYVMGTGVQPISRSQDYDIDLGIILEGIEPSRFSAMKARQEVYNALHGVTPNVFWKAPCVTVQYMDRGAPKCHVDIAVFAKPSRDNGQLLIAYGKPDRVEWERSNPRGLITEILKKSSGGESGAQFRRVVRYMKRWKDEQFPREGVAAPIGIGLTVAAHKWFLFFDRDDHRAVLHLVKSMRHSFSSFPPHRLSVQLPVTPHNDVFEKMSDQQMLEFSGRLVDLERWLGGSQPDFRRAFGSDFPA